MARTYPSECSTYQDKTSGVEVTQLTRYKGHSHHFYFTNPGWYDHGRKLLVSSDRENRTNLFGIDMTSGEIEQLTDLDPVPLPRELEFLRSSKNPVRDEVYFWHDVKLMALDIPSGTLRVLTEIDSIWCVSMTNAGADGEYVYFGCWLDQSAKIKTDLHRGYVGFEETWAARPTSRVMRVASTGGEAEVLYEEDYWIGHVNTSPTQPNLLTFCHEGPWGKVDQRIWGFDVEARMAWKIRPTQPGEIVGHEYWHADGVRIGYHGHGADDRPFLGRVRHDDQQRCEAAFPGYTGHIHSNDASLIVGDGGGVIRLWQQQADGSYSPPRVLCRHDSAMRIQQTHPHPRFSPDSRYVVFTSDRSGYGNVYRVEVQPIESLPLTEDA